MAIPRPVLLGHRGASKYARENTVAAFDLALKHGCDGFEFDIRYTHDARSVICHDPRSGRRRIDRARFCDLDLPSAEEVIGKYLGRAYLDIELKVPGEAAGVLAAAKGAKRERFIVSSFLPEVLQAISRANPDIPLALICENERQLRPWSTLPIRAVMLNRRLASASLIDELHSVEKQVFVWTVNRQREMLGLAELGVEGLISDDTQLLASTFQQN